MRGANSSATSHTTRARADGGLTLRGVAPPKVFDMLADEPKGGSILSRFEGAYWRLLSEGRLFFEPSRLNDPLSNGYVVRGSYEEAEDSFAFVAEGFRSAGHQLALDGFIRREGESYRLDCLFVDEGTTSPVLHVTQQLEAWDGREVTHATQTIKGVPVPALYDLRLTGSATCGKFAGVQECLYTTYSFSTPAATEPDDVRFNISNGSALEASEEEVNGVSTLLLPLDTLLDAAWGALPSRHGFALKVEGGRILLEAEGEPGSESIFSWREVEGSPAAEGRPPRAPFTFCEARRIRVECVFAGNSVTGEIKASGFATDGRAALYEAVFEGRRAADMPQAVELLERKARLNDAERSWRDANVFEGEWQSQRFGSVRLRQHEAEITATFSGETVGFKGTATEHRLTFASVGGRAARAVLRAVRGGQFLAGLFSTRDGDEPAAELLYRARPSSTLVEDFLRATPDPLAWGRMADTLKSLNRYDEALTLYEKLYDAAGDNRRHAQPYSDEWTWFFSHEWGALLDVMSCYQMRHLLLSGLHPRFRVEGEGEEDAFESLLKAVEHAVGLQEELQQLARRAAAEEGVEFPDFGARLAQQVESWRRTLGSEAERLRVLELGQRPLPRLLKVLTAGGSPEQALVAAESARARVFSDLMQTRIYRERASESFASLKPEEVEKMLAGQMAATAPVELEALRQTARELRATTVEYYLDKEELYVWVLRPDGEVKFHRHQRAGLKQSLTSLVAQTRVSLGVQTREAAMKSAGRAPREYLPPLAELYDLLVAPVARWLPEHEDDEVIFVPHEALYLVPFPALFHEGHLVERHTISVAPSIRFVETAHQLAAARASLPPGALVVGDPLMPFWPRGSGDAAHRLPQLQFSRVEAEQVAAKLRSVASLDTVALVGEEATRGRIVAALPEQSLVHLATHGLIELITAVDEVPGAIALGPAGEDDGYLTASQIAALDLRARLVVMSACNTGRGRLSADGVVGLVRAFLTAGVECVVASLWSVGDESTQELMVSFYEELLRGRPAAHALRRAMLDLKAEPRYDNPLHWAAFIVTGQCREPLFDTARA